MIPPDERLGRSSASDLGTPLRAEFKSFAPKIERVVLRNRSQFGAWAELNYGVARRYGLPKTHLVYLTISYFIDAGIIIDSKLYTGAQGISGQYAHLLVEPKSQDVPCDMCGLRGCLWAMGSGLAMLWRVKGAAESGNSAAIDTIISRRSHESTLEIDRGGLMLVESDAIGTKWIDARAVVDAAQEDNDPQSREAVRQVAIYIGRAVAQIINGLNPHLVVLGGVAANGNFISEIAAEEAKKYALTTATRECHILPSAMGDMATLLGAAMAARKGSPFDASGDRTANIGWKKTHTSPLSSIASLAG
jgi:glucokinase